MSRSILFALLALPTLACGSSEVVAPNASPNTATYTLTFTGNWTAMSHPQDYPKGGLLSGPHFSGLIGATHNGDYRIIKDGQPPTPGLERLSEAGKHSPLDEEIRAAIAAGGAGTVIETDHLDPTGTVRTTFTIDQNHPMVSLVAMIAPSPDWFTGAGDLMLWENGDWVQKREVDVFAWDAGGDDGATYEAPDDDTHPKKLIGLNQSPIFVRDGAPVLVGRLVLERK